MVQVTEVSPDTATPDGPRKMRADAQRNHDKILEAAEEVFARDGVAVPIDLVAERAGVGIGTLYRHFPTKEALFEAIVAARLAELIETADVYIGDADTDPKGAFNSFLQEFARQATAKQHLFDALDQSGLDFKVTFADGVDALHDRFEELRRRAAEAGAIRADIQVEDIMTLVMGSCKFADHSGSDDQSLDRCLGIVIAGLQAPSI
ncbi:MAG: TetR/AcrR family transcriptional regulator [Acidimicrobiales bacterium]